MEWTSTMVSWKKFWCKKQECLSLKNSEVHTFVTVELALATVEGSSFRGKKILRKAIALQLKIENTRVLLQSEYIVRDGILLIKKRIPNIAVI